MTGVIALKDTALLGGLKVGEFKAHLTKNQMNQARNKPEIVTIASFETYSAIYQAIKGMKPEIVEKSENKKEK